MDTKKKNMIIIISIAILVPIILVILINIVYNGSKSYSKAEEKLKEAAKEYYKDRPNELTLGIGESYELDSSTLVANEYIKSLDNYIPNNSNCTGKVILSNTNGNILYNSYLDCGEDYQTKTLIDYIITNETTVTEGEGLHEENNQYIYKGDNPNNFIKIDERLYRILNIDENNKITIILSDNNINNRTVWDNRYNIDKKITSGINDYEISRVYNYLNELIESEYFNKDTLEKLEYQTLCIDKISLEETVNKYNCNTILEDQIIGLVDIKQYMTASLDKNCTKATDGSCQNYNYLSNSEQDWWTLTGVSENSDEVYFIGSNEPASESRASNSFYIRETIKLTNNIIYVNGKGTENEPYLIK